MQELIKIENREGVDVVDYRDVATGLGVEQKATLQMIDKYRPQIEDLFGQVAFEMEAGYNNAQVRVAYLNEGQAMFIANLSRNSKEVIAFKGKLVKSFLSAREVIKQLTTPMDDEMLLARALQISNSKMIAAESRAKLAERNSEVLEAQVKELQPMANYAMEVLDADKCYTVTEVAAQLGKSAQWLNKQLAARQIIRYVNGSWVITAKYSDRGFHKFRTKKGEDRFGNPKSYTDMLYTETGRQYIHGIFNPKLNPSPTITAVA